MFEFNIVFGPVPSRRLGRSLGINNITAKTCSYSCVYCQIGRTTDLTIDRKCFYRPEKVLEEVIRRIRTLSSRGEKIDYITFVPDGEPTLDSNIGKEIVLVKRVGVPVAVITNASLLWRKEVIEDLLDADYVSLKIDAVSEEVWKRVNRAHPSLKLDNILNGIREFSARFRGKIVTETMLINGVDYGMELEKVSEYLKSLRRVDKAYISIPTRPPAEKWVKQPREKVINLAFQTFSKKVGLEKVELLVDYEGDNFTISDDIERDFLSIMAVHPMRRDAVESLLTREGGGWHTIEKLLNEKKIVELEYEGKKYYMINLGHKTGAR
ncbi:MAG: radical SAM protein [Nitrososphaeria archaeon]